MVSKKAKAVFFKLNEQQMRLIMEMRAASARKARALQHTPSRSKEREQQDAEIADYLARNPHVKVY